MQRCSVRGQSAEEQGAGAALQCQRAKCRRAGCWDAQCKCNSRSKEALIRPLEQRHAPIQCTQPRMCRVVSVQVQRVQVQSAESAGQSAGAECVQCASVQRVHVQGACESAKRTQQGGHMTNKTCSIRQSAEGCPEGAPGGEGEGEGGGEGVPVILRETALPPSSSCEQRCRACCC